MSERTWQEHIEALEIERTQLPIPSSRARYDLTPTPSQRRERHRALIEAAQYRVTREKRTA